MRPRVFPAEDIIERNDDAPDGAASMRPRVFPAEDLPIFIFHPTLFPLLQ